MEQRSAHWIGTSYLTEFSVPENEVRYAVWQREVCPTTGRSHWQFYCQFKTRKRLGAVKGLLGECHAEVCKAPEKAKAYCKKAETRAPGAEPIEIGKAGPETPIPMKVQKRGYKAVIDENPQLWRSMRALQALDTVMTSPRSQMTLGIWLSGDSGKGKSKIAQLISGFLGEAAWIAPDLKWFDGYSRQALVVVDELREAPVSLMLRLVDRYPLKVPVKGGFAEWKPRMVIFTSNLGFMNVFGHLDDYTQSAIKRRIKFYQIY